MDDDNFLLANGEPSVADGQFVTDDDGSMQDTSSEDEDDGEEVLEWGNELSILYHGTPAERIDFLNGRDGMGVSPFGVHAIFELLLGNDYCEDLAEALVEFMETLVRHHLPVYTQMVKAFMDFPWRLLATIQDLSLLNLSLALRLVPFLNCMDDFEPSWVSRSMCDNEGWDFFNLPLSHPDETGVAVAERTRGMQSVLKFLLEIVGKDLSPKPVMMNRLIAFVHSLLIDEGDRDDGFQDSLVLEVFEEKVTDIRTTMIPRFMLGALLGRLAGKDKQRLNPEVIEMLGLYMESDMTWAILTELSMESVEWMAPLLSFEATHEEKDGLAVDHAALDLLESGLKEANMRNDPVLRGGMKNALWLLSNLAVEDVYKSILVQERPMRIFIGCWGVPPFHDTVTSIFKNLFAPNEATVDMLNRIGWSAAYQQSSEILDVLDI